jgi:IMP cyclohydrolase
MANRKQNERRFPRWDDLPGGGRRYYRIRQGKAQGYARYVKIVDADEVTVRLVQEIYDDEGRLIGIHQKYPDDTGHRVIGGEGDDV